MSAESKSPDHYDHDVDARDVQLPAKKTILLPHEGESAGKAFKPPPDNLSGVEALKFSRGHAPYVGAIRAPSNAPSPPHHSPPSQSLDLDWVYGITPSLRGCVFAAPNGCIVYSAAAVGVVFDPSTNQQKWFRQHTDDVTALAQSPTDGMIFASGQKAALEDDSKMTRHSHPPVVAVWDAKDCEQLARITLDHEDRTVRCIQFSPSGKLLAVVVGDDKHTLRIFDWDAQKEVAHTPTDNAIIYSVSWNPANDKEVIITGKNVIKVFDIDGALLKEKAVALSVGHVQPQPFYTSCYSMHGHSLVGAFDGHVYVLNGGDVLKKHPITSGKIFCMCPFEGGFAIGTSDRSVIIVDAKLTVTHTVKVPSRVFSVAVSKDSNTLVIATEVGDLFVVGGLSSLPAQKDITGPVASGHWDGELWAITAQTGKSIVASAGEDNTLRLWDLSSHKQLKKGVLNEKKEAAPAVHKASTTSVHPPNQQARAVAISPDGAHIAVGLNNGELAIYDANTLAKVQSLTSLNQHGKRAVTNQTGNWIQAIQYSPSGNTLAVGTHGAIIALLDVRHHYDVKGVIKSHNSFITNIDWSEDGTVLQSNCGAMELLFHKVDESKLDHFHQITEADDVKDTKWATQTLLFSWATQGIFSVGEDSTSVHAVSSNKAKTLLATGDDRGQVKLFAYPAASLKAESKAYSAHSSHIPKVIFSSDDQFVLSAGGHDGTIIQWRVK